MRLYVSQQYFQKSPMHYWLRTNIILSKYRYQFPCFKCAIFEGRKCCVLFYYHIMRYSNRYIITYVIDAYKYVNAFLCFVYVTYVNNIHTY